MCDSNDSGCRAGRLKVKELPFPWLEITSRVPLTDGYRALPWYRFPGWVGKRLDQR